MDYSRPRIHITLTPFNKALNLIALILLLLLIASSIYLYTTLPDIIPTHFDLQGNVNDRGSKNTIWILVFINIAVFFSLNYLARRPHLYNYPTILTEENAERQYRLAARLMRTLKLTITITFMAVLFLIYTATTQHPFPYGGWELPVILSLILVPIGIYFFKAFKN